MSGKPAKMSRERLMTYWTWRFTAEKVVAKDADLHTWLALTFHCGRFQLEQGEGGQAHYQGVIHTRPRMRYSQLTKIFKDRYPLLEFPLKDYLAPAKSQAADEYVMKEDTRIAGPWEWNMPKAPIRMTCTAQDIMSQHELPEWSNQLIEMVKGKLPDKTQRSIFWYWSEAGERFKTETTRHLVFHHDAVVIQGLQRHILAAAYTNPAPIYILIMPREYTSVSYSSIEQLKDGLYMSGFGTKCTGMVNRRKPWVIVVGNRPPTPGNMSTGRIVVTCVD